MNISALLTNDSDHIPLQGKEKRLCLYSFGGHSFPLERVNEWQIPQNWSIVLVEKELQSHHCNNVPGVVFLSQSLLEKEGILYVDLINAMVTHQCVCVCEREREREREVVSIAERRLLLRFCAALITIGPRSLQDRIWNC